MNKNAGFTLIEVLIAMVVLAVGLLGLAGLQVTSLRNNQSAYNRSQATQLSYDLADRMRAMRASIVGIAAYTAILPGAATAKANCLNITGCTPADMAENDLYQWNLAVTTNLPSGAATIAVLAGVYTISINWDDNRDGSVDNDDPNFQTSFQL
jgi:type IV pilus assembly protein PilV